MKIFLMIMLFLVSGLSWGGDVITITQPSGRGTSNELWVEMTRNGLESHSATVKYEVGTCATSLQAWDAAGTRDPIIMLYSSNWYRTALQTGQPCAPRDADRLTVYVSTRTPWWLCRNRSLSRPMAAAGVTLGYHAASTPGEDIIADINATNGYHWRGVSTKGTGDNFMLLTNGELDYAFMASNFARRKIVEVPNSPLECVASWKKNDTIPYFKDMIHMKGDPSDLLYYSQIIVGKNLTLEQDRILREIYGDKNPQFREWIQGQSNGEYLVPTDSRKYMIEFMGNVKKVMDTFKQ